MVGYLNTSESPQLNGVWKLLLSSASSSPAPKPGSPTLSLCEGHQVVPGRFTAWQVGATHLFPLLMSDYPKQFLFPGRPPHPLTQKTLHLIWLRIWDFLKWSPVSCVMPANSVVVTVTLICLLWVSHHTPFQALHYYSLCLPHSLIFSFHVFTISLPLTMKCSVSPIFAFVLLTNDWPICQIQWMCSGPCHSGPPCHVQHILSTLFWSLWLLAWSTLLVFLLCHCPVSPLWASLPWCTPCFWHSVLGGLWWSSFRTSAAHWVFVTIHMPMTPGLCLALQHSAQLSAGCRVYLKGSLNLHGLHSKSFLLNLPFLPSFEMIAWWSRFGLWNQTYLDLSCDSDTSLMFDLEQVIELPSLNVFLLKMGIKIVPISGGSFEADPNASE